MNCPAISNFAGQAKPPVVVPQNNDGVFVDSNDRQSIVFVRANQ